LTSFEKPDSFGKPNLGSVFQNWTSFGGGRATFHEIYRKFEKFSKVFNFFDKFIENLASESEKMAKIR